MKRFFMLLVGLALGGALFAQSAADEILKWKQLYDKGIITEAEFQEKKNQILGGNAVVPAQSNQNVGGTQYTGQYVPGSPELYAQIENLIEDDLEDNKIQIAQLSQGLTQIQRDSLCRKYEKNGGLGFALNLLVGFGVGSFVQGDGGGGAFQCAFEGSGLLFIIVGASLVSDATKKNKNTSAGYSWIVTGASFVSCAAIYGLIRPWFYASGYNNKLHGTLSGNPMAIQFAPVIDPINNNYGLMAKVNL